MVKKISKNIKECPYCGHDEYYIKQSFTGVGQYNFRYDGGVADNEGFYENSAYKNTSKYAWCSSCNKKLFELD